MAERAHRACLTVACAALLWAAAGAALLVERATRWLR